MFRVLIVDDNPLDVSRLNSLLQHAFKVSSVESIQKLTEMENYSFDVIVLDLGLPDSAGLETIEACRQLVGDIPIMVYTGNDFIDNDECVARGADEVMTKSYHNTETFIRRLIRSSQRKLKGLADRVRCITAEKTDDHD